MENLLFAPERASACAGDVCLDKVRERFDVQRTGVTLVSLFNDCTVEPGAGNAPQGTYFVPNGASCLTESGQVSLKRSCPLFKPLALAMGFLTNIAFPPLLSESGHQ